MRPVISNDETECLVLDACEGAHPVGTGREVKRSLWFLTADSSILSDCTALELKSGDITAVNPRTPVACWVLQFAHYTSKRVSNPTQRFFFRFSVNHKAVRECGSVLTYSAHVRSIVFSTFGDGNANLVKIDVARLFMLVYLPSLLPVALCFPSHLPSALDINISVRCAQTS
jgi:hypothetical protein